MLITDEIKAIAARKEAIDFHTRHEIKSVNDLTLHSMAWSDLNGIEKDARKSVSNMLDRAGTDEQMKSAGTACDAFSDLLVEIRTEKDERTLVGNKGPREQREHAAMLAKRPGYDTVSTSDEDNTTDIALRSDQSFKTWARARSDSLEHLRGMNAGQFLRAMVINDKSDVERRALSEASDAAGGYTVPDVLSAELIDKARADSVVMRAGARTVPLTSDSNTIAKVLTDPTPAWRLEAGSVANSDGTFGAVVLIRAMPESW